MSGRKILNFSHCAESMKSCQKDENSHNFEKGNVSNFGMRKNLWNWRSSSSWLDCQTWTITVCSMILGKPYLQWNQFQRIPENIHFCGIFIKSDIFGNFTEYEVSNWTILTFFKTEKCQNDNFWDPKHTKIDFT